jgi:BlaI family penicillinase repressor
MSMDARISDAEARVMEVLWDRSPQAAAEVIEALTGETGWNHRTIRTLLRRLMDKGAVSYVEDGRAYLYAPILPREEYVRSESRSFLARVFGGNPLSAMAHFVEDEHLTPEELKRLQSLVEEKREELP